MNQYNAHSTTLMIGELFIQVIRFPNRLLAHKWMFNIPVDNKLFLIWPADKSILNWQGEILSPKEMHVISESVHTYAKRVATNRGY